MNIFKKKPLEKELQKRKEWKITSDCLSLILESSKSIYPNEFIALLRTDEKLSNVIVELILLPGTVSGNSHAILNLHMKPFDSSIVGTIHSHPSPSYHPSKADQQLFRKYGKIHMIVAYPFTETSWMAYDAMANTVSLHVI